MNGVVLINKEKDFTSFDVVAVVRKTLSTKKVGHTGTLDPNAEGLLPVLIGSATKAQDVIPCHDKRYTADFRFGLSTDTLDIWGEPAEHSEVRVTREQLAEALGSFRGEITQLPPMYSAVSVDGKRLYQYAREGREVGRRLRSVTIYALELLDFDEEAQSGTLDIACSKGTYVRTLIDDIARSMGALAVMTGLIRTEACGYSLGDAVTLDELKTLASDGTLTSSRCYRDVESLFSQYPALTVSDKQAHRFVNGNPLDIARTGLKNKAVQGQILRLKDSGSNFLSLGIVEDDSIKMYKHF